MKCIIVTLVLSAAARCAGRAETAEVPPFSASRRAIHSRLRTHLPAFRGMPRPPLAVAEVKVVPPKGLHTVKHQKDAGDGYTSGSPLYAKQEQMKRNPRRHQANAGENQTKAEETWCSESLKRWLPKSFCTEDTEDKTYYNLVYKHLLEHIIGAVVHIVVLLLCAYCYRTMKSAGYMQYKTQFEPQTGWAYSCCSCDDCREDWPICCVAFCCPVLRWADTFSNSKVQLMQFWPAVVILVILNSLATLTAGVSLMMLACFLIFSRQRIRKIFGHNDGTCHSWCEDILAYCCCCWCCATVQEAREVDKVRKPTFPIPTPRT